MSASTDAINTWPKPILHADLSANHHHFKIIIANRAVFDVGQLVLSQARKRLIPEWIFDVNGCKSRLSFIWLEIHIRYHGHKRDLKLIKNSFNPTNLEGVDLICSRVLAVNICARDSRSAETRAIFLTFLITASFFKMVSP